MSNYAMIDISLGAVVNTIVLDEDSDWTPPEGFIVVRNDVASIGWSYADGVFSPPPIPPLTPQEIFATNQNEQISRLSAAAQSMAPVVAMITIGDATDAETLAAKAWQAYYRALKLVDLSAASPEWPTSPDAEASAQ